MKNYFEKQHIDRIYEICENIPCKKYYTEMAVAWLVCEGFVKFRDETLRLLERGRLDSFVTNMAVSKCRDSFRVSSEDKNLLLKFRKK